MLPWPGLRCVLRDGLRGLLWTGMYGTRTSAAVRDDWFVFAHGGMVVV